MTFPATVLGKAATSLRILNANSFVRRFRSSSFIDVLQGEVGHNQTILPTIVWPVNRHNQKSKFKNQKSIPSLAQASLTGDCPDRR